RHLRQARRSERGPRRFRHVGWRLGRPARTDHEPEPESKSAPDRHPRFRFTSENIAIITSAPSAPSPKPITFTDGFGGFAKPPLGGDGVAGGGAAAGRSFLNPISHRSRPITVPSASLPRGWNASLDAAITWLSLPSGGPPHTPRCGCAHVIGPVHQWRIA